MSVILEGRKVKEVRIGDAWFSMRLMLPRQQSAPRFTRVQLLVENVDPRETGLLMIGKVEPLY